MSLKISGDVEDVLFSVERSGEGLTLDDAVETELLSLTNSVDSDHLAKIFNNIINNCGALGVDHSLRSSRQSKMKIRDYTLKFKLSMKARIVY